MLFQSYSAKEDFDTITLKTDFYRTRKNVGYLKTTILLRTFQTIYFAMQEKNADLHTGNLYDHLNQQWEDIEILCTSLHVKAPDKKTWNIFNLFRVVCGWAC